MLDRLCSAVADHAGMRVILAALLLFSATLSLGMTALYVASARYLPIPEENRGDDLAAATEGLLSEEETRELRQAPNGPRGETIPQALATNRRHQLGAAAMGVATLLQGIVLVMLGVRRRWGVMWLMALAALLVIAATQIADAVSIPGLVAAVTLALFLLACRRPPPDGPHHQR